LAITPWGPVTYPVSLDSYYTTDFLTDLVDVVEVSHPNSIGESIIAIETKLGVTGTPITGLGGVSFASIGEASNPSGTTIPTLWVDSTTVGFDLTYSYNGVDTVLGASHAAVTLAASATTGGLTISTQEIGNTVAAGGGPSTVAAETNLGSIGSGNFRKVLWANGTWYGFKEVPNGIIYRYESGTTWTELQNTLDYTGDQYISGVLFNGEIWTGARYNAVIGICSYNPVSDVWTSRDSSVRGMVDICTYGSTVAFIKEGWTYKDIMYVWDGGTSTTWTSLGDLGFSTTHCSQIIGVDGELYVKRTGYSELYQFGGGTTWTNISAPFTVMRMGTWNNTLVVTGTVLGKPVVYKYESSTWTQLGADLSTTTASSFGFIAEDSSNTLYAIPHLSVIGASSFWYKYNLITNSWIEVLASGVDYDFYPGEFNLNDVAGLGVLGRTAITFKDAYTAQNGYLLSTDWATFNDKADSDQTMYIGTTAVTIDRTSAALTLSGITFPTFIADQYNLSSLNVAPASAGAAGTLGEIRIVADAIYVCWDTDTWVKTDLATWV